MKFKLLFFNIHRLFYRFIYYLKTITYKIVIERDVLFLLNLIKLIRQPRPSFVIYSSRNKINFSLEKLYSLDIYAFRMFKYFIVNPQPQFIYSNRKVLIICESINFINDAIRYKCMHPNSILIANFNSTKKLSTDEIETYIDMVLINEKSPSLKKLKGRGFLGTMSENYDLEQIYKFFFQILNGVSYSLITNFSNRAVNVFNNIKTNRKTIKLDSEFINKTTPASFKDLMNQLKISNLMLSEDLYWMTNIYSQSETTANELNNFVRILLKKGVYVL